MINTDKNQLRKETRGKRDGLANALKRELSERICESIRNNPLFISAKLVYFYVPVGSEVDISPLYEDLLEGGEHAGSKLVAFPRVDAATGDMSFYEVKNTDELHEGTYGVPEPDSVAYKCMDGKAGLMIIPGVAFDKNCGRMGQGKGYYDKYLAKYSNVVKFGACYNLQLLDKPLPCEKFDVYMDYVVTEEHTYSRHFDYNEMVEYISEIRRFGKAKGVDVTKSFLSMMGHPEKVFKFIHVAGTNGKGSTCAYLNEILINSGIRAGVFTSPHLITYNERIAIGHDFISDDDVERIGNDLIPLEHMLCVSRGYRMTMFDFSLAMALMYFKEKKTEFVILETGLGGRYDSTNAIQSPIVTVITSIGLEHTDILGDTHGAIAYQKAGILKPGTIAVIMPQESEEAMDVLCDECRSMDIPFFVGVDLPDGVRPSMKGDYQYMNAATAREAAYQLSRFIPAVCEDSINKGIREAYMPGRMEMICELPMVILDCAHNPHGARAMAKSLRSMYPGEKFVFYMGVMADKDYRGMIEEIRDIADIIYTVKPKYERALSAVRLSEEIRSMGIRSTALQSPSQVMDQIRGCAVYTKSVVFGSVYLIGEIREIIEL